MKRTPPAAGLFLAFVTMILLGVSPSVAAPLQKLAFSGGPNGGTFEYFSNGIATRLTRGTENLEVVNQSSAGSVENIRRVNAGDAAFGIAYSGDLFLARRGLLQNDQQTYLNALALANLYGAPAQLVVLADSPIRTVHDLAGKTLTIGGAGSGSAAAAERYLKAIDIWDRISIEYVGYSLAAAALSDRRIDAMWIMAGTPTAAVQQAAAKQQIRLIDVLTPALETGFFKDYPFYSQAEIPGGTYPGVDAPVGSFQDSAIWIAGKQVSPRTVQQSLDIIFSQEGLDYMRKVKKTAVHMSESTALNGIVTPFHPGAEDYWKQQDLPPVPTP